MNVLRRHPRREQLVRYALYEARETDGSSATHLLGCVKCRRRIDETRQVVALAQTQAATLAPDALLLRVLASRTAGVRVLLATDDIISDPAATPLTSQMPMLSALAGRRRQSIAGGLAAAAALFLATVAISPANPFRQPSHQKGARVSPMHVTGSEHPTMRDRGTHGDTLSLGDLGAMASSMLPMPSLAEAQEPATGATPPFQPIRTIDLTKLHPGSWTYVRTHPVNGKTVPYNVFAFVSADTVRFQGKRAWRMVTNRNLGSAIDADTVYLRVKDMRLIGRRSQKFVVHMEQDVADNGEINNTVTIRIGTAKTHHYREIDLAPSDRLTVSDEAGFHFLMHALPLRRGWKGSVALYQYSPPPTVLHPSHFINLEVDGEENVSWLWYTVACWRVAVGENMRMQHWYVSKATGDIVQIRTPNQPQFKSDWDLVALSR